MYTYFLTIDKVKLGKGKSTKLELIKVRNDICAHSKLWVPQPYVVHCFEKKHKGKKEGYYLHYHVLLVTDRAFIPFKEVHRDGYSIVLKKLKTMLDVVRTAGYINKLKVDKCDIEHIDNFLKKKLIKKH